MKRFWEPDELADHFTLTDTDWDLISNKTEETRLGFAVLLKYLPYEGSFPKQTADVPPAVIAHIATQVEVAAEKFVSYAFSGRTHRDHRSQIRTALHYRPSTEQDLRDLSAWLVTQIRPEDHYTDAAKEAGLERLHTLRIEPPSPKQVRRALKSAAHTMEEQLAASVSERLTPPIRQALDDLLRTTRGMTTIDYKLGHIA